MACASSLRKRCLPPSPSSPATPFLPPKATWRSGWAKWPAWSTGVLRRSAAKGRARRCSAAWAIAVLARKQPQAGIKVALVWFVERLNSLALSDRLQATQALVILTDQPNPSAVDLLRERALPALVEMARWKTLEYALPAYLLLGRVAGIAEEDLQG